MNGLLQVSKSNLGFCSFTPITLEPYRIVEAFEDISTFRLWDCESWDELMWWSWQLWRGVPFTYWYHIISLWKCDACCRSSPMALFVALLALLPFLNMSVSDTAHIGPPHHLWVKNPSPNLTKATFCPLVARYGQTRGKPIETNRIINRYLETLTGHLWNRTCYMRSFKKDHLIGWFWHC